MLRNLKRLLLPMMRRRMMSKIGRKHLDIFLLNSKVYLFLFEFLRFSSKQHLYLVMVYSNIMWLFSSLVWYVIFNTFFIYAFMLHAPLFYFPFYSFFIFLSSLRLIILALRLKNSLPLYHIHIYLFI